MKLFTKEIEAKLLENYQQHYGSDDTVPVVKIFNPYGAGTWLLSEMDEEGFCFGLCDLGMGFPEMGGVHRRELEDYRNSVGLGLERDMYWTPHKSLTAYANEAYECGSIRA